MNESNESFANELVEWFVRKSIIQVNFFAKKWIKSIVYKQMNQVNRSRTNDSSDSFTNQLVMWIFHEWRSQVIVCARMNQINHLQTNESKIVCKRMNQISCSWDNESGESFTNEWIKWIVRERMSRMIHSEINKSSESFEKKKWNRWIFHEWRI